MPVSYTHLDVYKRQIDDLPEHPGLLVLELVHILYGLLEHGHDAAVLVVQDVYKRQAPPGCRQSRQGRRAIAAESRRRAGHRVRW